MKQSQKKFTFPDTLPPVGHHRGPYFVWTRSEDDQAQDLETWKKRAQVEPFFLPCLDVCPLPPGEVICPPISLQGSRHIVVVTSARGVKIVDETPQLKPYLSQARLCITHGTKTAQRLQHLGYPTKLVENIRTARDLGQWVAQTVSHEEEIIFISPRKPAFDMVQFLRETGFKAHSLICYETSAQVPALYEKRLLELLARDPGQKQTIWSFASPTAVEGLLTTLRSMGLPPPSSPLGVAVIGPTTEQTALKYFSCVKVSGDNTLEGLIETALECATAFK